MLLLLVALVASILLGYAPAPRQPSEAEPPAAWEGDTPLVPSEPTETPTTAADATAVALGTSTPRRATPAPTPTPDPLYVATSRLSGRPQEDHFWLARPIAADSTDMIAPSYPYGSRNDGTYPIHQGVEFVNPMGTEVLAVAAGTIVVAGEDATQVYGARTGFYGQLAVLELDRTYLGQPVYALHGHLSKLMVEVGQRVEAGDVIALVGMTGVAEGPHLHFEVRWGKMLPEYTVNPELWLRPLEGRGALAGLVVSTDDAVVPEVRVLLYRAEAPEKLVRQVVTYPNRSVGPDPSWGENFAAGDLTAGRWVAKVYRNRIWHTAEFTIIPGATVWLRILVAQ